MSIERCEQEGLTQAQLDCLLNATDWEEFKQVLSGNGPCNRERLAARVKAWEEGEWVREAALAFARKQDEQVKVAA